MTPRVLVIAGLDPTGGAGLTADLAVLRRANVAGVVAATAITVQDAGGVRSTVAMSGAFVAETVRMLADRGRLDAVKIGMLATREIVDAVARSLRTIPHGPVVLDPVLVSGTGVPLLEDAGVQALLADLVPQSDVLTPNVPEAARLTGSSPDTTAEEHRAQVLRARGARAVLLKGGHRIGEPDDVWVDAERTIRLYGRRLGDGRIHGAGCALASWIAAGLALGFDGLAAARRAKAEVAQAIESAEVAFNGVRYLRW